MKLAIIIEGVQNSGKTSTILHFVNQHQLRRLSRMRTGWQSLFLNPVFKNLKIHPYIIPSSPTESNNPLSNRFLNWSNLPDLIIMAEQTGGNQHIHSINFLTVNGYAIINFHIRNVNGNLDWERFDNNSKTTKLTNRANQIMDSTKSFIKINNIV